MGFEEHINILELRAATVAVHRVLKDPLSPRRRLLLLSDSSVVVGALFKGRSSSSSLLRRMRSLSAMLLASGLQVLPVWLALPATLPMALPPALTSAAACSC